MPFRPPPSRPLPGRGLGTSHSARSGPHSFFSYSAPRCQVAVPTAGLDNGQVPRCTLPSLVGGPRSLDGVGFPQLTSSRRHDLLPRSTAAETGAVLSSWLASGKAPPCGAKR